MTHLELLAEAVGINPDFLKPLSLPRAVDLLAYFCREYDLFWYIEPGVDFCYAVIIQTNHNGWEIVSEACNLVDAIVECGGQAYSNLKGTRECKVLDFDQYKKQLRS